MTDIERKAKAYDELKVKASRIYHKENDVLIMHTIEDLFPELKESEDDNTDEKIRKALIKFVTNHASMDLFIEYDIHLDEALAWLENQHKKDEEILVLKDQIESLHAAIKALKDVHKIELEKQGEQKSTDEVEPIEWSGKINSRNAKGVLKEMLDKKLKSDNKIEPRFKVGDKIQYSKDCGTIMTIEKIENDEYVFANNMGHTTIEDGNKWYLVECNPTWSKEDEYYYGVIQYILNNECVGKTDKENAIKWFKSLKDKIQPQPKQEWKQENTSDLTDFENAMMHIGSSFFGENAGLDPNDTNAIKEQANLLLELVQKQGKQKTVWSEEDENAMWLLKDIVRHSNEINENIYTMPLREKLYDWLKSIKDRVQQKQDWSEEDKERIKNIISVLDVQVCWNGATGKKENPYQREIDWLKSFIPQNKWKPSDEQIKALETTLYTNMSRNDERYLVLSEFVEELKKLK